MLSWQILPKIHFNSWVNRYRSSNIQQCPIHPFHNPILLRCSGCWKLWLMPFFEQRTSNAKCVFAYLLNCYIFWCFFNLFYNLYVGISWNIILDMKFFRKRGEWLSWRQRCGSKVVMDRLCKKRCVNAPVMRCEK